MILRPHGPGRLLIAQHDHAALAGRIMREWRADGLPSDPALTDILYAIDEHDNGWQEPDRAPVLDAEGRMLDFISAPAEVRQAVWPRGLGRLAPRPLAAALVAQHALHIYRRHRGDAGWTAFFAEIEGARERHRRAARLSADDLQRRYFFLRVGDLASLVFCNGWSDTQADDTGSEYSIRLEGDRLIVAPDPFAGRRFPIAIAGRALGAARFASAAEAQDAYARAPTATVTATACGD